MSGTTRHEDVRRLVRPYVVTDGRTRPTGDDLALETLVTTTPEGHAATDRHVFEQRHILTTCRDGRSIADVAAALEVPAGVARVLVGDLVVTGMLSVSRPTDTNEQLIRRLIDGVRSL